MHLCLKPPPKRSLALFTSSSPAWYLLVTVMNRQADDRLPSRHFIPIPCSSSNNCYYLHQTLKRQFPKCQSPPHPYTALHRPASTQHNLHSLKQNLNIQPHPPFSYVFLIQLHDLFKIRNLTSPANLPHTCNSWFYAQPDPMA